ncbi:MAG: hypothetical protein HY913_18610 [Desulfomonile tiedjei]|nr:hypothetical protein [Desulfomonile tiedjei]
MKSSELFAIVSDILGWLPKSTGQVTIVGLVPWFATSQVLGRALGDWDLSGWCGDIAAAVFISLVSSLYFIQALARRRPSIKRNLRNLLGLVWILLGTPIIYWLIHESGMVEAFKHLVDTKFEVPSASLHLTWFPAYVLSFVVIGIAVSYVTELPLPE